MRGKWISGLLDLIYPRRCTFCHRLLEDGEGEVCTDCEGSLRELTESVKRGEFFTCCHAVYAYEGSVRDAVLRFKFSGRRQYAGVFGKRLAELLRREQPEYDLITWAPISRKRLRKRGYDQGRLLAEATASALGAQCTATLKKIRHAKAQSSLPLTERKTNIVGAYRVIDPSRVAGKRILLIDDVITSGATLSECSRMLRSAGATQVVCATLAATQEKR